MSNKQYVMTDGILKIRSAYGSDSICQTCGIKIKIGDSCVSGHKGKRKNRIRHESCARRVGLID